MLKLGMSQKTCNWGVYLWNHPKYVWWEL